jgi:hypothetical protein
MRHEATWPIRDSIQSGAVGVRRGDDYYVVPDDDPRLANQAPGIRRLGHDDRASFDPDD